MEQKVISFLVSVYSFKNDKDKNSIYEHPELQPYLKEYKVVNVSTSTFINGSNTFMILTYLLEKI